MQKLELNFEQNVNTIKNYFSDCGDLVEKELLVGKNLDIRLHIFYFDLLTDRTLIEKSILDGIMISTKEALCFLEKDDPEVYNKIKYQGILTADYKEDDDIQNLLNAVLGGDTVLLIEGVDKGLVIATKGFPNRGIPTVENEIVIEGARDSFSEVFRFNTVLIRRRIRDTNLKTLQTTVGKRSKTDIAIMYMDNLVQKDTLTELLDRLNSVDIDTVFDLNYLSEIAFNRGTIFPMTQKTERPDKACSAILEGRIVLVMDNTPIVLILPTIFDVFMQSAQDYYDNYLVASFVRVLRYTALFITLLLPAIYLCVTIYHPSMISRELIYRIISSRKEVPYPPLIEFLLMDFAFELLKEASLRLPVRIGSTLGIVGGLIVGQSSVEAGLVSPIVVIIVALSAIASFAVPNIALSNSIRMLKYLFIIFSGILGFFGFIISLLLTMTHLVSLSSFGVPYLYPFVGTTREYTEFNDTILRMPHNKMLKRPIFTKNGQKTRQKEHAIEHDKQ